MKIPEIILFVILVLAAVYTFDWHDFNRWLISALLLLNAALIAARKTKTKRFVRKISLMLAIFLILKILTTG